MKSSFLRFTVLCVLLCSLMQTNKVDGIRSFFFFLNPPRRMHSIKAALPQLQCHKVPSTHYTIVWDAATTTAKYINDFHVSKGSSSNNNYEASVEKLIQNEYLQNPISIIFLSSSLDLILHFFFFFFFFFFFIPSHQHSLFGNVLYILSHMTDYSYHVCGSHNLLLHE